jgi:hypothetical protein
MIDKKKMKKKKKKKKKKAKKLGFLGRGVGEGSSVHYDNAEGANEMEGKPKTFRGSLFPAN